VFGSASNYAKSFTQRFGEAVSFTAAQSTAAGSSPFISLTLVRMRPLALTATATRTSFVIGYVLQLGLGAANDPKNQTQVGAALHALDTMQTFYGPVNFDSAGSNVAKPMIITQVEH
jgi:ABC-type branched-subunit amino acid transport system substrate-binding protein